MFHIQHVGLAKEISSLGNLAEMSLVSTAYLPMSSCEILKDFSNFTVLAGPSAQTRYRGG